MVSESGDIEAVMSLITAGADINHQNQVEIHMYIRSVLFVMFIGSYASAHDRGRYVELDS